MLIKIWLEVGQAKQERRFSARINDPLRQWKLSPMDLESYRRWYAYSRARDMMLGKTDSEHAPWYVVRSDDKRRARLNCISHCELAREIEYTLEINGLPFHSGLVTGSEPNERPHQGCSENQHR